MPKRKRDEDEYEPESEGSEDDVIVVDDEENDGEENDGEEEDEFVPKPPPRKKRKVSKPKKEKKKKKSKKSSKKKKKSNKKSEKKKKKKNEVVVIKDMDEAKELIRDHLYERNRPYSVQNIIDNTRGQVKKTLLTKVLAKLIKEGEVTEKINKKTKIYQINQENMEVLDEEELDELDESVKKADEGQKRGKIEVKKLAKKKSRLTSAPTNDELAEEIRNLEKKLEEKNSRLEQIKKGLKDPSKLVSKEEKEVMVWGTKEYLKMWKRRKEKVMDVVGMIADGRGKKPSKIIEDVGLETDQEVGANYAEIREFLDKL